jgi:hypothetical protein
MLNTTYSIAGQSRPRCPCLSKRRLQVSMIALEKCLDQLSLCRRALVASVMYAVLVIRYRSRYIPYYSLSYGSDQLPLFLRAPLQALRHTVRYGRSSPRVWRKVDNPGHRNVKATVYLQPAYRWRQCAGIASWCTASQEPGCMSIVERKSIVAEHCVICEAIVHTFHGESMPGLAEVGRASAWRDATIRRRAVVLQASRGTSRKSADQVT